MAYEQDAGPALAPNLIEALRRAFRAHAAGELREAEFGCRLVLAANKKQFEALHLLGLIEFQRGKLEEAERLMRQALRINPRSVQAHTNLGSVLQQRGRHQEALASLDRALALDPGNVLALSNRGQMLWRLKRPEEALASLDRALALKPDYVDALCTRGNVLTDLRRLEGALASYDKALEIAPNDALVLNNRGNVLWALQRRDEAMQSYDRALAVSPNDLSILNDRGTALSFLHRSEEALACFDRALALKPDDPYLLYKRGGALADAGRHEEALDCFDQAFAMEPGDADALDDRGNVLAALQRHAEALASFDQALTIAPESAKAHWNRGLMLLRVGDFEQGWREYEWRLKLETSSTGRREFVQPRWLGEQPVHGKTILLYSEQGFGDTIQFVRYVPLVAGLGAKVILEVQPALKGLLANLDGAALVLGKGEGLPPFDLHCPLMSLPLAFKTRLDTIPAKTPYLYASEERVNAWKEQLPESALPRVGICWAGNPDFPADKPRSIGLRPVRPVLPLLSVPGVQFISIQKDLRLGDKELLREHPQLIQIGDKLDNFGDTAAVMSLLDLVISSDTSPAHLAGALGRPVWILLQHTPDWRWLLARDDNPWYPSARLFRQPQDGDWGGAVARLGHELKAWITQACG
jgi:tetratricopeptide (TPR) repeat protein